MADITTTSTSSYPSWAVPYAQGYLERAQSVADNPYQAYTGQMVADMSGWQNQGYQALAQRAMSGSPLMGQASQALSGMFSQDQRATSNPYGQVAAQANSMAGMNNPYLGQQIQAAQQDTINAWNNVAAPSWATANSRSGSFGNSGLAAAEGQARDSLQRNLGNIASTMRMQDYTQQQQMAESMANRQLQAATTNAGMGESYAGRADSMYGNNQARAMQALGMAPSFANQDYADINNLINAGSAYQTQNQKLLDNAYSQFLDSRNYPAQQLQTFGQALSQAVGGQGTQTTTQPGASTGSQLVGGALTGSALYNLLFGG